MASEITVTLWADVPASDSLAFDAAEAAATAIRRSTDQQVAVAAFAARSVEPRDVDEAVALAVVEEVVETTITADDPKPRGRRSGRR